MDNSRSLEAIYQDGTGMVSLPKKSYKASIEGYDGFGDVLSMDLAKSEETLAFIDTYRMIETKAAVDKIKMLKKINANYGSRSGMPLAASSSIESFCNALVLSAEGEANALGNETGNEKVETPENTKKKGEFFKKIFEAIGKVFKAIWNFFKGLVSKIVGLFKKKEEAAPKADDTIDVNIGSGSSDENKSANNNAGSTKNTNVDYINADIYYLDPKTYNPKGINKFVNDYTLLARSLGKDFEVLKNYGNDADANAAAKKAAAASGDTIKLIENTLSPFDNVFTIKGEGGLKSPSNPGNLEAMKKYVERCSKEIKWESASKDEKKNGGVGAYKLIEALFGMKYDKKLGETLANKNAHNILANYDSSVKRTRSEFANTINPTIKGLEGPHNQLVSMCDELSSKFDAYASKIESSKGNKAVNPSDYWGVVAILSGGLKLCTKVETVVVRCTAAVFEYLDRFIKLLDATNYGKHRAK